MNFKFKLNGRTYSLQQLTPFVEAHGGLPNMITEVSGDLELPKLYKHIELGCNDDPQYFNIVEQLENLNDRQLGFIEFVLDSREFTRTSIQTIISWARSNEFIWFEAGSSNVDIGELVWLTEFSPQKRLGSKHIKHRILIDELARILKLYIRYGWLLNHPTNGQYGIADYITSGRELFKVEIRVELEDQVCENLCDEDQRTKFLALTDKIADKVPKVKTNYRWFDLSKIKNLADVVLIANELSNPNLGDELCDPNIVHLLWDQCKGDVKDFIVALTDNHSELSPVSTEIDVLKWCTKFYPNDVEELLTDHAVEYVDLEAVAADYARRFRVRGENKQGIYFLV